MWATAGRRYNYNIATTAEVTEPQDLPGSPPDAATVGFLCRRACGGQRGPLCPPDGGPFSLE
jgi:hypothetical protein